MTARYYVLAADELMDSGLQPPAGFRFVEQVCAEPGQPGVHWWLAEDDGAPESLNGKRIEPLFTRRDDGTAYVSARRPAL